MVEQYYLFGLLLVLLVVPGELRSELFFSSKIGGTKILVTVQLKFQI